MEESWEGAGEHVKGEEDSGDFGGLGQALRGPGGATGGTLWVAWVSESREDCVYDDFDDGEN